MTKTMQILNAVEDASLVGGTAVSLSMIQTILGITLLVINICLIITKLVLKIIDRVKKGDYSGAVEDVEKTQDEIKSLGKDKDGKD